MLFNRENCDECGEEVKSPYITWIEEDGIRIYFSGHKQCMNALRNKKLKEQEEEA